MKTEKMSTKNRNPAFWVAAVGGRFVSLIAYFIWMIVSGVMYYFIHRFIPGDVWWYEFIFAFVMGSFYVVLDEILF